MLTADTRRAFGPRLLLSALLLLLFWVAATAGELSTRDQNALLMFMLSSATVPVLALSPVIAALPFATGYAADRRSGMDVMMRVRCGSGRFLGSKLLCCLLSGGLALAIGTALYALLVSLWFSPDNVGYEQMIMDFACWDFSGGITLPGILGFYAVQLCLQFLAGCFYSASALAFSAFVPNISLTLCVPLVLYRLLEECSDHLPPRLSPYLLQTGSAGLGTAETLLWALIVFGGATALLSLIFLLRAKKRMARS